MRTQYPYLKDYAFLKDFDKEHLKEKYVKITILNWQEEPLEEVQGIVTGGNLTLDGNSNVRRTCQLSTFIKNKESYSLESLFSINKKMFLEIGYANTTEKYLEYPIIWFPQGTYVMINPSFSHSLSGTTLSMQLKDKMCLLNGEVGGIIPASTQLDRQDTIGIDGKMTTKKVLIKDIIKEVVNHFGGEQLGKIIIEDIDNRVKQVMKWTGNFPVYLVKNQDSWFITSQKPDTEIYKEFSYGDDIGYVYTDFVYPEDFIGDAGSTVTSILDKIVGTLGGNYEYFYDIDGNFRMREKKNFLNTSRATAAIEDIKNQDYLIDLARGTEVYNFDKSYLISSYSNTPQYNKIKNDFTVWGLKENANGNKMPIWYHLAIDEKPKERNIYPVFFYKDPLDKIEKAKAPIVFKSYESMTENNGVEGLFYLTEDTGEIFQWVDGAYKKIEGHIEKVQANDWRTELYLRGTQIEPTGLETDHYYTELLNEWPKIYNLKAKIIKDNEEEIFQGDFYEKVKKDPSSIDYFLDMIDSTAEVSKYSIKNIGKRSVVVNDNDVNCVFEPAIPDFILIKSGQAETEQNRLECIRKGQNFIQISPNIYDLLNIGGNKNSAYNRIRQMLFEYTKYENSISLQSIPVFYLEPNTIIQVNDIESNIYGDYMISTISISLSGDNSMSISATKALERI